MKNILSETQSFEDVKKERDQARADVAKLQYRVNHLIKGYRAMEERVNKDVMQQEIAKLNYQVGLVS